MEIVFATNNKHKIEEISGILDSRYSILSLRDLDIIEDIPEDEDTLEGNALAKARFVYLRSGKSVFADDTGLEVDSLNGAPGVYSARYAGPENSSEKNIEKLLFELKDTQNRSARFRTVIALILDGKEFLFDGVVEGSITNKREGEKGFGYDPVFIANGMDKTFAEISASQKNRISHRGKAVLKLVDFLDKLD
jgi:XTP/dITP diphosphohydrolase